MKTTAGRPRETGELSDYESPKLVLIEKCSRDSYWYKSRVGTMLIVCESDDNNFRYDVLEKMNNGKFANNGRHLRKKDTAFVCNVV